MAELINLNKVRKLKAHEAQAQKAAENRVKFGRTKAEKARDTEAAAEAQRRLDNLKRERPVDGDASAEDAQSPE